MKNEISVGGVFEVLATGGDSALGGDDFDQKIVEKKIFFPTTREGRNKSGKLNHKNIFDNLNLIKDLQIYDLETKEIQKLTGMTTLIKS